MKQISAWLTLIAIALIAVVGGYLISTRDRLLDLGVESAFSALGMKTVVPEPSASDPWFWAATIGIVALAGILFFLAVNADSRRRRRLERRLNKLSKLASPISRIYSTESGRYGFVALKVAQGAWGPAHPLFEENAFRTSASVTEPGFEYRFVVVQSHRGSIKPIPLNLSLAAPALEVWVSERGLRGRVNVGLRSVHKLFYEANIPVLSFVVTAVCVAIIGVTSDHSAHLFNQYRSGSLGDSLRLNIAGLRPPPDKLQLHAAELSLRFGDETIKFHQRLAGRSFEHAQQALEEIRWAFPVIEKYQVSFATLEFD